MLSDKIRKQVILFIQLGHTVKEAAEKFSITYATVTYACEKYGIKPQRSHWPIRKHQSSILILKYLMDEKLSYKQIGEIVGVSAQRVSQIYKKAREIDFPNLPKH